MSEIASHTYSHPRMQLTGLPDGYTPLTLEQCQEDITRGRSELEAIFNNAPMRGLAWPYGNPRRDDLTEWIAGTGVVYIRPTETTGNFDIPTNWLDWRTTCHHNALPTFGPRFLEQPDDGGLKLLAVWGHSYEFDKDPNASTPRPNDTWNIIEDFAAQVKGRDDIWKATNIEVYDYIQALDGLEITQTYVKNNSDRIAVNIMVNGKKAVIEPGMTYRP